MSIYTYNPKKVTISLFGLVISEGLAQDTFITCEKNEDDITYVVGADGSVSVAASGDNTWVLTLTLLDKSPHNAELSAAREAARLLNDGVLIGPALLKDLSGTDLISDGQAVLMKPPSFEKGNESSTKEWMVLLPNPPIVVA